jgi:hypothetical protein
VVQGVLDEGEAVQEHFPGALGAKNAAAATAAYQLVSALVPSQS